MTSYRFPYSSLRLILALLPGVALCALPAAPPAHAESGSSERILERFDGKGGRGPYFLAWRGFTPGSERVTRNGFRLYRQQDYWVDYAAGTFALLITPSPADEIRVEYRRGSAQANTSTGIAPTVRLFDSGSTRLQASYGYAPSSGGASGPVGVSSVGLGAETSGRNWKINSGLLLATQGGAFNERSGMRFGGEWGLGALQLSGDYARSGAALDPKGAHGLQKNQQSTNLGLMYRPSDRFRFSTQYKSFSNKEKNEGKNLTAHELALKPSAQTSLLAARTTEETAKGGKSSTLQTDTLALEYKPTVRSTLIAKRVTEERSTDDKEAKPVTVQTDTLRVEQKLTGETSAIAELQSVSSGESNTETARVGVSTKILPGVALETTAYQKQIDPGGDAQSREETGVQAKLVTATGPLQVQTRLEQKQMEKEGQSTAGLEIASKGGTVKLKGELGKNTGEETEKNRINARLEVNPVKPVKLVAGITQTEETTRGGDEATDPIKGEEKQVGVEIKPNDALSFSAHLQTANAPAGETNVTALSTQLRPLSFLQISGTLKQRETPEEGLADADTRIAQVSVSPWRNWKLTGGYIENPEENGKILESTRRRYGLETTLGAFLLNGGYELEDRSGGLGLRTTELGLGVNFSSSTHLRALYKIVDGYGTSLADTSVYGLKFSRNLGDSFNLSLEGETSHRRDAPTADLQKEYKGAAKLGVRF